VEDEIQKIVAALGVDVLGSVAVEPYDVWTVHVHDLVGTGISVNVEGVTETWLTRSLVEVVVRGQQGVLDQLRPRVVIVGVLPESPRIEGMLGNETVRVLRPSRVHLPR
jgi:hypothetical protein